MTIKVKFGCDGCHAEADGTTFLRWHFSSFNGKGYGFGVYGFGVYSYDGVRDVLPDGWVAFDLYTGCCYCPDCWADIEGEPKETAEGVSALADDGANPVQPPRDHHPEGGND